MQVPASGRKEVSPILNLKEKRNLKLHTPQPVATHIQGQQWLRRWPLGWPGRQRRGDKCPVPTPSAHQCCALVVCHLRSHWACYLRVGMGALPHLAHPSCPHPRVAQAGMPPLSAGQDRQSDSPDSRRQLIGAEL